MKKLLLYSCLIILVLGFTLSTLATKAQKKYYVKRDCGKGYVKKDDDCGVKKKGWAYEDECKKGWKHAKKGGSGWVYKKKKEPECHYDKYEPPYCGKCYKRHYGYCKKDYGHGGHHYGKKKYCDDDGYKKKNCYKPYKKCDDDYECYGKGYKKYKERKIGCAPPK